MNTDKEEFNHRPACRSPACQNGVAGRDSAGRDSGDNGENKKLNYRKNREVITTEDTEYTENEFSDFSVLSGNFLSVFTSPPTADSVDSASSTCVNRWLIFNNSQGNKGGQRC